MRTLIIALLLIPTGVTLSAAPSPSSEPVAVYQSTESYDDVKANLEMAITDRGMLITNVLHISDMLARTAADTGLDKKIYQKAESMEFCSIQMSYQMSLAHPANMATCPLTISIYQTPEDPQHTYVAYRRAKLLGDAEEVQNALDGMLQSIVSDALE